jgi:hypothetical protein
MIAKNGTPPGGATAKLKLHFKGFTLRKQREGPPG